MESLKLKMVNKNKYDLEGDALVIPSLFTKESLQFGGMIIGCKGRDGITRYTVDLQVTDQQTNKSIAETIQRKIGKLLSKARSL